MQSALVSYYKRYKMEVGLVGLPSPVFPQGFQALAWRQDLLVLMPTSCASAFTGKSMPWSFPAWAIAMASPV